MTFCSIFNSLRGLFFILTSFMPLAISADFYKFEILGEVFPLAMNNQGQVVGITSNGAAFLWDSLNGIREIGPNKEKPATAYDISNSGDILGFSVLPWVILDNQLAYTSKFVWRLDGNSKFLFGSSLGTPYGRNEIGDLVGVNYSTGPGATFNNQIIINAASESNAVNNSKKVVGWRENPFKLKQTVVFVDIERYRYNPSGRIIFNSGKNLWHNDNFYVNGYQNSTSAFHYSIPKMAFIWNKDTYLLLEGLGGPVSEACDINNNEEVVGFSTVNNKRRVNLIPEVFVYEAKAVLWMDGQSPIDLMTLIPELPEDISLKAALFINDAGQILCSALRNNKQCAILLSPKNEFMLLDK